MKKVILSVLVACLAGSAMAKPASPKGQTYSTATGEQVELFGHGDEFYHYLSDKDGNVYVLDDNMIATAQGEVMTEELMLKRRAAQPKVQVRRATQFINHAPRGIVILVNFNTTSGTGSTVSNSPSTFQYTRQDFDDMLNKTGYVAYNGAVSCAREYFETQSWGQYSPQFDVYGPYTLANKMTYYGGSTRDSQGNEDNPYPMIREACQMAHDAGADFSQYDNDNDGKVDFVFVFYAGYGQADSNINATVWPHMWWLTQGDDGKTDESITLDGKVVDIYACSSELCYATRGMDGIATFCHEFSHVMGFPDLYDTDGKNNTLGSWDVMDYGPYNDDGYTPPCYSAYERFYAEWMKPVILNEPASIELEDLNDSQTAYLISETGQHNLSGENPNPKTFWLIENRQQKGYDKFLPGHGLLLTKVQYNQSRWDDNTLNNYSHANQGVAIQPADGKISSSGDAGDPYPGTGKKTSFTTTGEYNVTNIVESNGVISFDFMGGKLDETLAYLNYSLKGVTQQSGPTDKTIKKGEALKATFVARQGYFALTEDNTEVAVTVGGQAVADATLFDAGLLTIELTAEQVTDDVVIMVEATQDPDQFVCDDYSYTFTSAIETGTDIELNDYLWDFTVEGTTDITYNTTSTTRGMQIGSTNNPATSAILETASPASCNVKSITINAGRGAGGDGKLAVFVGDKQIGSEVALAFAMTNYVFTPDEAAKGAIKLQFTNTKRAVCLKSINIEYGEEATALPAVAGGYTELSVVGNEVTITALQAADIEIYNLLGQMVEAWTMQAEETYSTRLAQGLYLVKVLSAGESETHKIMIR